MLLKYHSPFNDKYNDSTSINAKLSFRDILLPLVTYDVRVNGFTSPQISLRPISQKEDQLLFSLCETFLIGRAL